MVVRLLVVVAALTGLFAMHGLGDHGAPSQEMAAVMHPAATATSHLDHGADAALGETGVPLAVAAARDGDSSGMAMAGLCLAVLGGAVIGLLRLGPRPAVVLIRATAWRSRQHCRRPAVTEIHPACSSCRSCGPDEHPGNGPDPLAGRSPCP